jgi:heat-inducible transcriptional repressor
MKLYGKENLFDTPEFAEDAKKLQRVLRLLDDPQAMRKVLESSQNAGEAGVKAAIGDAETGLEDVAVLTAEVKLPGQEPTSISLLGPTRMDYEKAMGLLEYVSKTLDSYFNEEEKGEETWPKSKKKTSSKSNKKLPPSHKKKN